ncbi:hypothetical protein MRX96_030766 [Rhipicephalus microplus]
MCGAAAGDRGASKRRWYARGALVGPSAECRAGPRAACWKAAIKKAVICKCDKRRQPEKKRKDRSPLGKQSASGAGDHGVDFAPRSSVPPTPLPVQSPPPLLFNPFVARRSSSQRNSTLVPLMNSVLLFVHRRLRKELEGDCK